MTPPKIALPPEGAGLNVVASVSGGKDSTALILALREAEIPGRYVFADTMWEADETYNYLSMLEVFLNIEINRVGVDGGMVARVRHRAGFPGRMQRFCTRELKIEPLRAFHDKVIEETGIETVSAMGVRAQESEARRQMPEWEDEGPVTTRERWGGYVWRPLIAWTVEDVLLIHRRHGVPVNPLYQRGHDRVGCYPCIYASKEEIRLVAEHTPQRIDFIRELEGEMSTLRHQRNAERPGRYAYPDEATFFQTRNGRRVVMCKLDHDHQRPDDGSDDWGPECEPVRALVDHTPMHIDEIVAWARTDHGGKQGMLFAPAPQGGCMRWGLCETSPTTAYAESLVIPDPTEPVVSNWTGPLESDLAPDGSSLLAFVPGERWPYGPPSAHDSSCMLHKRAQLAAIGAIVLPAECFCDCAASDASDVEHGIAP